MAVDAGLNHLKGDDPDVGRPDISEAADSLLWFLAGRDFAVGPAEHLRVQRLLASLAAERSLPQTDEQLGAWIGPLICRSERDQERFDAVFAAWLRTRPHAPPRPVQPEEGLQEAVDTVARTRVLWTRILGFAILAIGGYFAWRYFRAAPQSGIRTAPAPKPTVPVMSFGLKAAIVLLICAAAAALYWYLGRRRARAFLVQRTSTEPAEPSAIPVAPAAGIYNSRLVNLAAQGLGTYRRLASEILDVRRSVNATAREAGRFIPVYAERAAVPEFLILIDRGSPADLFAQYATGLAAELERSNLAVEWFYFDSIPRQCYSRRGNHPVSTRQLAERFPDHRLMVFSDAAGFLSADGSFAVWMKTFDAWEQKTLVTPNAREYWGRVEAALADAGWTVIPAEQEELAALARQSDPPPPATGFVPGLAGSLDPHTTALLYGPAPPAEEIDALVTELRFSLGAAGFEWLCACAAYPGVDWNVTMYLGANRRDAGGKPLLSESAFLALARLPWFRYGAMPEWFRLALMRQLPSAARDEIRALLQTFLLTGGEGAPAAALDINVRKREALNWLTRRFLRERVKTAQPEEPLRDRTFLEFLSGRNPAALPLPERIARAFRKRRVVTGGISFPTAAWQLIALQFSVEAAFQKVNFGAGASHTFGLASVICGFLLLRRVSPSFLAGAGAITVTIAVAVNFGHDPFINTAGVAGLGLFLPSALFLLIEETRSAPSRLLAALALWFAATPAGQLLAPHVLPILSAGLLAAVLALFNRRLLRALQYPKLDAVALGLPSLLEFEPMAALAVFLVGVVALAYPAGRRVAAPVTIYSAAFLWYAIFSNPEIVFSGLTGYIFEATELCACLILAFLWRSGRGIRVGVPALAVPFFLLGAGCALSGFTNVRLPTFVCAGLLGASLPVFDVISIRAIAVKPKSQLRVWSVDPNSQARTLRGPLWLFEGSEIAGPAIAFWYAMVELGFVIGDVPAIHNLPASTIAIAGAVIAFTAAIAIPFAYRFEFGLRDRVPQPPLWYLPFSTAKDRFASALCYFLFGVPALFVRTRFVRFHAIQAMLVTAAWLLENIALMFLHGHWPLRSEWFQYVYVFGAIVLAFQALRGRMTRIPLLGNIAFEWTEPPPQPAARPAPMPQPQPQGFVYISSLVMLKHERDVTAAALGRAGFVITSSKQPAADLVIVISDAVDYYSSEERLWQRMDVEQASKTGVPVAVFVKSEGPVPSDLASRYFVETFVNADDLAEKAVAAAFRMIHERRSRGPAPVV